MQIHCSTRSVLLNVIATHYTCPLNGLYCPHWLVQWSHHCSCMHIPVHSAGLLGYINVIQTILLILTMAELFPDTHCTPKTKYTDQCLWPQITTRQKEFPEAGQYRWSCPLTSEINGPLWTPKGRLLQCPMKYFGLNFLSLKRLSLLVIINRY